MRIPGEKTAAGAAPRVRQTAYLVARAHKVAALARILDLEAPTLALVFCRMRTEVDALAETLSSHGYQAQALHGGMTQEQRDRVMKRTRGGTVDLLIATDVAARGLDIEQLSHVVNFDVPQSPAAYLHRIGRTGRAGREGVAITLVEPREHRLLRTIEQTTKRRIDIATVPTVLDVRARRLDVTRASIRELIVAGDLDTYRVAVEALTDEFDLMDIATAAVRLAHEASQGPDGAPQADIPVATLSDALAGDDGAPSRKPRAGRESSRERPAPRPTPKSRGKSAESAMARIYIGAGRKEKMRAADLVGAIANEAGIDASGIGAIEIGDDFSLVELPEVLVDQVVAALRAARIKGKRLTVRRDKARR